MRRDIRLLLFSLSMTPSNCLLNPGIAIGTPIPIPDLFGLNKHHHHHSHDQDYNHYYSEYYHPYLDSHHKSEHNHQDLQDAISYHPSTENPIFYGDTLTTKGLKDSASRPYKVDIFHEPINLKHQSSNIESTKYGSVYLPQVTFPSYHLPVAHHTPSVSGLPEVLPAVTNHGSSSTSSTSHHSNDDIHNLQLHYHPGKDDINQLQHQHFITDSFDDPYEPHAENEADFEPSNYYTPIRNEEMLSRSELDNVTYVDTKQTLATALKSMRSTAKPSLSFPSTPALSFNILPDQQSINTSVKVNDIGSNLFQLEDTSSIKLDYDPGISYLSNFRQPHLLSGIFDDSADINEDYDELLNKQRGVRGDQNRFEFQSQVNSPALNDILLQNVYEDPYISSGGLAGFTSIAGTGGREEGFSSEGAGSLQGLFNPSLPAAASSPPQNHNPIISIQDDELGISDMVNAYHTYKQQWTTTDKKKMVKDASKALQDYYAELRSYHNNHPGIDIKSPDFDTDEYGRPKKAASGHHASSTSGHHGLSSMKDSLYPPNSEYYGYPSAGYENMLDMTPGEMMDYAQVMMHRAMRNTINMFKRMNMKESGMHMIRQAGYTTEEMLYQMTKHYGNGQLELADWIPLLAVIFIGVVGFSALFPNTISTVGGRKKSSRQQDETEEGLVESAISQLENGILILSAIKDGGSCSQKLACTLGNASKKSFASPETILSVVEFVIPDKYSTFTKSFQESVTASDQLTCNAECRKCVDF